MIQNPAVRKAKGNKFIDYQRNQIMSLNSLQLLIKVYDFVILNCKKGNIEKASEGIVELISALDFNHQEISVRLFRLYQYCLDKIKQGEFEESVKILEGLRESWVQTQQK